MIINHMNNFVTVGLLFLKVETLEVCKRNCDQQPPKYIIYIMEYDSWD